MQLMINGINILAISQVGGVGGVLIPFAPKSQVANRIHFIYRLDKWLAKSES